MGLYGGFPQDLNIGDHEHEETRCEDEDENDSRVRENWGKLDSMTSVLFAGFFPFYLVVNPSNLTGCEKPLCETDLDKNIIFYYSKKKAIYWLRGPIPKKYINVYFSTDLPKWAQID